MRLSDSFDSDRALVQAALRRDSDALGELLERMRCIPRILAAKNRRSSRALPGAELEDLAQETFALVWSKLPEFAGRGCLEAWLYRFCCNVLMNAQQRSHRQPESLGLDPPEVAAPAEPAPLPGLERDLLLRALQQIDPAEARVIELKHLEGLTFTEIGAHLDLSPNSAKTRYYRGLQAMRRFLAPSFRESARG